MKKVWYKKASIAFVLSLSSMAAVAADKALIIGVGNYPNPQHNLGGINLDVDMADEIAQRMGFSKDNIIHLTDSKATRHNIINKLQDIANTTGKNDRVFVYYSGHGAQVKDTNGDESDHLDETLYVYDGHLLDDDINIALSKIKSSDMVVLIDACHSGTGTKSIGPNRFSQNSQKVQVKSAGYFGNLTDKNLEIFPTNIASTTSQHYISIGAAQDDEESLATPQGSVFTKSLYESIESARVSDSTVSWKDIFNDTKAKIDSFPMKDSQRFTPKLEGNPTLLAKKIVFTNGDSAVGRNNANAINRRSIIELVNKLPNTVKINAPSRLKVGEEFSFTVEPPKAGYLNVISVGADDTVTVLFPNKYASDNKIGQQSVEMPGQGKFKIAASEPRGETLVAVFVSDQPLDLRDKGFGILDAKGRLNNEAFARISRASLRDSIVQDNKNFIVTSSDSTYNLEPQKNSPVAANYKIVDIQ